MKKADLVEGTEYAMCHGKDALDSWRSVYRVQLVSNETYGVNRHVPVSYLREDDRYARAHLRWALADGFANDTTLNEKTRVMNALREAQRAAEREYFAEDPMRAFRPSTAPPYGDRGVVVRVVLADGYGPLQLAPRRTLQMTWEAYAVAKAQRETYKAEQLKAEQARAAAVRALRDAVAPKLAWAFEAEDAPSGPYLTHYGSSVSFTYEQALYLLNRLAAAEADARRRVAAAATRVVRVAGRRLD